MNSLFYDTNGQKEGTTVKIDSHILDKISRCALKRALLMNSSEETLIVLIAVTYPYGHWTMRQSLRVWIEGRHSHSGLEHDQDQGHWGQI